MSAVNVSAGTGVFVLSLLSVPISYLLNHLVMSSSGETVLFAGVSVAVILAVSTRVLLRGRAPTDPLFYVYAVYALLSVVNLIVGLEQDGIIDGFMTFYIKQSYRTIGLYWVGSFLMQIIVYIPGSVVGKYGARLNTLFLLHLLYACVSVWSCFRVFSQPATWRLQPADHTCEQKKSVLQRPLFFILYLLGACAFCIFRGLVALSCPADWCRDYVMNHEPYLKDPSAYPTIQMLVNMLYSTPCFVIMLYGLLVPGCDFLPDLSLVHAGAVAQAQFCHTGASLHSRTPVAHRVPAEQLLLFLILNLLYTLLPQLLSYRCISCPAFFFSNKTAHSRSD